MTVQVTVAARNGFSGNVMVTLAGLPAGTAVSPGNPFSLSPGNQQVSLSVPVNTTQGSFAVTVQGTAANLQHSTNLNLQVLQAGLASFSVTLNNSELSFSQGGSAGTIVGLSFTSSGNTNYDVQFSVTGLPSGVTAAFGLNPFPATSPATSLVFTASANSGLANYTPVMVLATRTADGAQQSASLTINVTPPQGGLPPIRTDFVREDGTPSAAVFDPIHNVVYASNPQWNRVDVISPALHQLLSSIPAPVPTGMDLSVDGKQLIVTSNVQEITSIDTTSLQVVQRTRVTPIVQGGATYATPGLIANTASGTALVGMTLNSYPPAYYLELWDPAAGTFTALSAPGVSAWINRMVRTGDGKKVLVVDYGSDVNIAVYDSASKSFLASGQSPVGQILNVAASPTAEQFAIIGTNGFAVVDANLNVVGAPALGGIIYGMTYSPDGGNIFVAATLQFTNCGTNYPVMLTFSSASYGLVGVAPAFEKGSGDPCNPYIQASPLTADTTGIVYSASDHGMVLDDAAANNSNLLNLPVGPPLPGFSFTDEAPLNATLVTQLGQIAFDVLPDVWFENVRATNVQFNTPLVSVTAPPSATAGSVNVKAVLPDGWFSVDPQAFSYGSQILFLGGTAGSAQGGETLAMIGYGLIGNNDSPVVTIGGRSAPVLNSTKYQDFNDSGYNLSYPFQIMDEVLVTVPSGTPGTAADVVVSSSAGTAILPKAFTYLSSVADYSSPDTLVYVLYDTQRHWVYLSAGDHIDVFSADTNQYLTPITLPSLSGARQAFGLAMTPDHSKLIAANFADSSVGIIDPDNPSSSTAVLIPVNVANSPGVAAVAATSTGKVFVDGISGTFAGCGGLLYEVDLATLNVTERTDLPFPGLQAGGNSFSSSADGSEVLLAGPVCGGTFLWNSATDRFTQTLTLVSDSSGASADGYWFASDYVRLDAQGFERSLAVIPEFFSALRVNTDWAGEKMNASGSLLYTPVPQPFGFGESNGIDITDTNHGSFLGNILLSEQITPVQGTMDYDEPGGRIFIVTNKGLTVLTLGLPPLSVAYLNPAAGTVGGGTAVTIRGSGFEPGATVSFGGKGVNATFVDASTLQVTTPAGTAGGARVSIQNPDGTTYALDDAFTYQ